MRLYLVRHGEARPGPEDALRPLTPAGRTAVEELALRAAAAGVAPAEIRHSGLVRARETAEILARTLAPPGGVVPSKGLLPDDDPEHFAAEADVLEEPVLVVTHMPFVARLTARLLGSRAGSGVQPYDTAEMRILDRHDGRWEPV